MSNVPYHSSIVKNYKTYENSFLPKIVHIPIALECDYEYKVLVKKGDVIRGGEKIATVGSTGQSTGPHLHFELRINNISYNPEIALKDAIDAV